MASDGQLISIDYLNEPIQDDVPTLKWYVWNEDEVYEHTIWMSAEWLSEEKPYEMQMAEALTDFITVFKRMVGIP